nr:hypothetical protein [Pseudorhodoferax sp. Leaf265]
MAGESPRDALIMGALMNARGLMELIIINIGLQAGVILHGLFAMLVLMAIASTLLGSPAFNWAMGVHRAETSGSATSGATKPKPQDRSANQA